MTLVDKIKSLPKNNPFWIAAPIFGGILAVFSPLGVEAILFSAFGVGVVANLLILRFTQPNLQGAAWELEKAKMEKEIASGTMTKNPNSFLNTKIPQRNGGMSEVVGFSYYD